VVLDSISDTSLVKNLVLNRAHGRITQLAMHAFSCFAKFTDEICESWCRHRDE